VELGFELKASHFKASSLPLEPHLQVTEAYIKSANFWSDIKTSVFFLNKI
jgi:hypothetical protein